MSSASGLSRPAKLVRTMAVALALGHLGVLAWLFARRIAYPYDLEWMEGGMLCHALRLREGQPIYAPPSVDFIPYLYTPLYPALLALLAKLHVAEVGYLAARLVSAGSFVGAMVLGWRFAARHGGSWAAATVAMALPAAAFAATGSWYDLARSDSLWLLLTTAGLLLLYHAARDERGERRTGWAAHLGAAGAGLCLVLAFFAKQTASIAMVGGGVALLLLNLRLVPAYGLALALTGLPALWLLDRGSSGWFWTYVFRLHQEHAFYTRRAFVETPALLARVLGPALVVVPWALVRRPAPALVYAAYLGLLGAAAACVGFGTQWAFDNAYIPGVFFPAIAIGVAAGTLVSPRRSAAPGALRRLRGDEVALPRLRPVVIYGLVGASLVLHPFDPRPFVPTAEDRAAGDRLIARLRAAPGDVLIPFHPFYAHLAGKRTYLHRMGVLDIAASGLGPPRGLAEAARRHRWSLAVFDDKVRGNWNLFPGLLEEYQVVEEIRGPRVVSGAQTVPTFVLMPRGAARSTAPPGIDLELQ